MATGKHTHVAKRMKIGKLHSALISFKYCVTEDTVNEMAHTLHSNQQ